jgi:hypothetical protein
MSEVCVGVLKGNLSDQYPEGFTPAVFPRL